MPIAMNFLDSESKGTKHMIGIAEKAGVPTKIVKDLADDWMP